MRYLVLIFIIIIFGCEDTQCDEVYLKAFTHFSSDSLNIYKSTNYDVFKVIKPDEEAGWMVNVIKTEDNYFKIDIEDLNLKKVWVRKGDIYLNTRNYNDAKMPLYNEPNKLSSIANHLYGEQTVKILNACKDWAYIEGKGKDNTIVRGWLDPDMQCGNPYTTCP